MATVIQFPPAKASPGIIPVAERKPTLPATAGRRGEYALADVARPLGLLHKSVRTIIDTLRVLAKHNGMPLPRTPRVVKGEPLAGPMAICKDSRWDAGEIDAWLDGRGPAGPAVARPSLPQPLRTEMAARAQQIGAAR